MLTSPHFSRSQRGITLIESLVAIVVTALGILGIVGVQMRTLTDTQTSVRRAQAIRLIEDLSERMKANPAAAGNLNSYLTAFGSTPPSAPNCESPATCAPAQLATRDLRLWKDRVTAQLPLADASVFTVGDETDANNRRQLGVMISWRENERAHQGDVLGAANNYKDPLSPAGTGAAGPTCPADKTCHLQYIHIYNRCSANADGGPANIQYFCPTNSAL